MQDVKEKVKQDYLKGMKQKEISSKYDISLNTLKSWIKDTTGLVKKEGCTYK